LNINCRSSNNWSVLHYSPEEIDIIAAYNPYGGEIYFIPISKINRSLFRIRISPTKNNQKLKIHLAKDFKELKV
jgi:hypothetical protein